MRSRWVTVVAGVVAAIVVVSVAMGLASPDGTVGDPSPVTPPAPTGSPTPSATSPTTSPTVMPPGALAPTSVRGVWPGPPDGVRVDGATVDWCGAVRVQDAAEAIRAFGAAEVRHAACAAVSFVFDHRYSRLALPRRTYRASDLAPVLPALTPQTVDATYRSRIARFLHAPADAASREALGLVLFHDQPGSGHVFYGSPGTATGYRDRAVWINPTWSTVTVALDRTMSGPRLVASLSASAAIPVYAPAAHRDDMMTVDTRARFVMRHGATWLIDGWTISHGPFTFAPLAVR